MCECRIIWNAASQEQIIRCPLHAAAGALLEACELVDDLKRPPLDTPESRAFATIRAAIKLAKGESDG
jgi:hypothetical protein